MKRLNDFSNSDKWIKYYRDETWYTISLGDKCIVDPLSKAKGIEKVRGRHCEVLYIPWLSEKVRIRYLDSGKQGQRLIHDLIPLPQEPISLSKYRKQK